MDARDFLLLVFGGGQVLEWTGPHGECGSSGGRLLIINDFLSGLLHNGALLERLRRLLLTGTVGVSTLLRGLLFVLPQGIFGDDGSEAQGVIDDLPGFGDFSITLIYPFGESHAPYLLDRYRLHGRGSHF